MTPRTVALAATVVLAASLLVRWQVVGPVRVDGVSMCPTLWPGQLAVLRKTGAAPRPGDVVALSRPGEPASVKRVVAVGGQVVEVRDALLHVDGAAVSEPFVDHRLIDALYFGPVRVPTGQLFVLGDARDTSIDSRQYGPVPTAAVTGVVLRALGVGDRAACPPGPS